MGKVLSHEGDSYQFQHDCGCIVKLKNIRHINKSYSLCQPCAINRVLVARNTAHNMVNSPEYNSWMMMRRRCNDPTNNRYNNYGGRGIIYDKSWESFENFYKDMGPRPVGTSLDRLDVDGDYCKENCLWSDDILQANNKTNNLLVIEVGTGVVWSLRRWCELKGLKYKSVHSHLKYTKNPKSISEILGGNYEFVQKAW